MGIAPTHEPIQRPDWQALIIGLVILLTMMGVTFMSGVWYQQSREIMSPIGR